MARSSLPCALLFLVMSGCVIPIAPEFEDPEDNYPPYILTSDPSWGDVFSPSGGDREISVTLADQNLNDVLYIRWIYDYPIYTDVTRLGLEAAIPPSGAAVRETIRFAPSCSRHQIARGLTQHRLVLSIADRPFLDADLGDSVSPEARLDSVPEGAHRVRVIWTLNLECKQQ